MPSPVIGLPESVTPNRSRLRRQRFRAPVALLCTLALVLASLIAVASQKYGDAATVGADLLLTHPLPLLGPIVAQKKQLLWVSSILAPASFLSVYDPIVPPQWPWLYHLMRLSPWVGRAVMALAKLKLDKILKPVYDLRAELGLPRGEQPILGGLHSPTCVLALFSKVLAQPQPDWPPNSLVTGFPFYDRRDYFGESEVPKEVLLSRFD